MAMATKPQTANPPGRRRRRRFPPVPASYEKGLAELAGAVLADPTNRSLQGALRALSVAANSARGLADLTEISETLVALEKRFVAIERGSPADGRDEPTELPILYDREPANPDGDAGGMHKGPHRDS